MISTLYEQVFEENLQLEKQIKFIKTQLQKLPDGKFFSRKNGKHFKWYYNDGSREIHLSKTHHKFAEKLTARKYLTLLLNETIQKQKATELFLKNYNCPLKSNQLLNNPAYQNLLSSYFKLSSQELLDWMNTPYPTNPKHPEHLIHSTVSGTMVRSKSEAFILQELYKNKIPFRYECELQLGTKTIYPDFTILHPRTRKIYYWDHFGMMDNKDYSQKTYSKLQLYSTHGIIPTINLITTYETKEHPLTIDTINHTIKQYFL